MRCRAPVSASSSCVNSAKKAHHPARATRRTRKVILTGSEIRFDFGNTHQENSGNESGLPWVRKTRVELY
eukprot:2198108-Rhodomonas_salina.1